MCTNCAASLPRYLNQPLRPTQPPTLGGMTNEYRPVGDALARVYFSALRTLMVG